jgi:hypothetical protein
VFLFFQNYSKVYQTNVTFKLVFDGVILNFSYSVLRREWTKLISFNLAVISKQLFLLFTLSMFPHKLLKINFRWSQTETASMDLPIEFCNNFLKSFVAVAIILVWVFFSTLKTLDLVIKIKKTLYVLLKDYFNLVIILSINWKMTISIYWNFDLMIISQLNNKKF